MEYINTEAIEAINNGQSVPKKIGDFRIKYVATDGWRGYYEAIATKVSGWVKIDSDWATGEWEDAPEDNKGSGVEQKLNRLYDKIKALGGELQVIFLPTSNVFSTAYDVFIRGVSKEQLEN